MSGRVKVSIVHLRSDAESDKAISEPGSNGCIRKIASHFENGVEGAGQEADFDAVRVEMKLTGAAHKLFEQEGYARISEAREPPRPTPEKRGGCEVDRRCNLRRQKVGGQLI